jgi:3D (Asp-Asp-Asp) domain-containing protein
MTPRARWVATIAFAGALATAGCGGGSPHPSGQASTSTTHAGTTTPARAPTTPAAATPKAPAVVRLQLALPAFGLSSAPTVRYATTAAHPALNGKVDPAAATVYLLTPDGTRTALNPRTNGSFSVRPKVLPGVNSFRFTAARLGAKTASASIDVTWRGPAAQAMQREMAAHPAKFLPPASAGLNRKIPALPATPKVAHGSVAVTFSLSPIKAGQPTLSGGNGKWLGGFELTEYYPALEAWFVGAPVAAAGLAARHRIDWLYSARGLSMEGDGVGLDGKQYHVENVGSGGWLTAGGGAGAQFGVGASAPYWRTGGFWRNQNGNLTFPLAAGGWSGGTGIKYVPPPGITFAPGPSRPLAYLRSVAVDPNLIPLGSHIYIPAYQSVNGGWFEADDTGGAIIGRHIDVFRPPPSNPADTGNFATGQRVYIVPPGAPLP